MGIEVNGSTYETDEEGNVTVVHATYDPETKAGSGFTGRKVKGTIHWVSAKHAVRAQVRLYDRLFGVEDPSAQALQKIPEGKPCGWMKPREPSGASGGQGCRQNEQQLEPDRLF